MNDFNWNYLMDFKLKPPYIPATSDWSKNIGSIITPLEMILKVKLILIKNYQNEIFEIKETVSLLSNKNEFSNNNNFDQHWIDNF
jgi:hypothetical protein